MMMLFVTIAVVAGYFLGNINGAVCISHMMGDDVRKHGSGNAGLTNFIRNYGTGKAVLVILIEAGKAVAACVLGGLLLKGYMGFTAGATVGGLAVMSGHAFPALLDFRGGKGILSGLFIALVADWRIALIILGVFALMYLISGYVSLGSVLAAITFGVCFVVLHWGDLVTVFCGGLMGCLATFMHRQNIARLLKGEERKTNLFKKSSK